MNIPKLIPSKEAFKFPFLKREKKEKTKDKSKPEEILVKGTVSLKDIIAPPAIEVDFDHIKIGNMYYRTLYVVGYPRFVGANWLSPLINFDHTLEIALFHYPVESKEILEDLKRKIAEMEATITSEAQRGRVVDPSVQVALDDALALQQQLAKGAERFFQFGLYITIPAKSLEELNTVTKQVESTLGSLLIISKHATLQMEEGFKTTLPLCQDHFMITRNMDTTSLATTFPFTSSELTANEGIMYGINEHNGSLIIFDRFTLENANSVVFAKAGAGKSLESSCPVLIKRGGRVEKVQIGQLVDQLIAQNGAVQIDQEIKGVINPNLEVFTFDKNFKGRWAKVTVAARKNAPRVLYKFHTASGRYITVTGDHNILVLRNGQVVPTKSESVNKGEAVPVPRFIPQPLTSPSKIEVLSLLRDSKRKFKIKGNRIGSCRFKKIKSLPLTLKLTSSFFRLLGYLTSEGSILSQRVLITNDSPVVQKDIKNYFSSLGLSSSLTIYRGKPRGIYTGAVVMVELMRALGVDGKAGEKRVPPLLLSCANNQVAEYLKAYFEGDGTVEDHEVTATSKSKELISDLMYLLLRFGIVARCRKRFKRATNTNHKGNTYYQLVISGQENLKKFAKHIGFVTEEKNKKLKKLLGKRGNTNVDTIPTLEPLLNEIYQLLFSSSEIPSPFYLSDLKRGKRHPSRKSLSFLVNQIENYIKSLERKLEENFALLSSLPPLEWLIEKGKQDKQLNSLLWAKLGQSWRLAKLGAVEVGCKNALKIASVVTEKEYQLLDIKELVKQTFDLLGISIFKFNPSLRAFLIDRPNGDGSYRALLKTIAYLQREAKEKKEKIQKAKELLQLLKLHLHSDLFWDPIVKIEKIPCKDKYVYDLMVNNEVFLAGFGGMFVHNSYLVKLECLRSLMFGTEIIIIDPEAEYKTLCSAIGGQYISFSFKSGARINPFDLSGIYEEGENELGLKILSLHGLFKVIMGKLSPEEEAVLDRALVLTYRSKGITPDPATQKKEPPLMEDLYKVLIGMETPVARSLADRIEKFIKGSLAGIFDQRSNIDIRNTFTVFSIRDLADELRPVAMYIILDYIWTKIKKDLRKRILVVDEAWYLMKYPDSALFLYSIAKRARKYYLGLTTITQDVEDFLDSEYGKAIITNSSIQILMKQSPAAIDRIAKTFYLSEGEKHLLLSCDVGEGLFFAGPNHVAMRVVASPEEHQLITTKPSEILKMRGEEKT